MSDGYVSLERICDGHGLLLRYHPDAAGYGSRWTFVVVAERTGNRWTLRAGWGEFSRSAWRQMRRALIAAGIKRVHWQRQRSEREVVAA
jgi:hypothetical protein